MINNTTETTQTTEKSNRFLRKETIKNSGGFGGLSVQNFEDLRKELLTDLRQKQSFRVSVGKSKWVNYETFNPKYNLREILDDEIVIEFDSDPEISWKATMETLYNLTLQGIISEVWNHGGRSPHIHIRNLPINHLEKDKRRLFKKIFIRNFVPLEYLKYVDLSLTGVHLLRIEWSPCWKKKYGIKKLMNTFDPVNDEILKQNVQDLREVSIK